MKKTPLRILLPIGLMLMFHAIGFTQHDDQSLRLKKNANGFFLEHKVSASQSLFALGRLYNVHPRYLADFNKIDYNKGLQLDQLIRIPLTDTNFQRRSGKGVPITLYASAKVVVGDMARFVGIDVKDFNCWNNFSGTDIKKGTSWIVGFLITNEMDGKQVDLTCAGKPDAPQPSTKTQIVPTAPISASTSPGTSFFEGAFLEQIRLTPVTQQLKVMSSVFKTQSGWKDGKYYIVIDNLVPGTLVRLVNLENGKEAYAKVLGELASIKQNEGLDMRISDAAAQLLGLSSTEKFTVQVVY